MNQRFISGVFGGIVCLSWARGFKLLDFVSTSVRIYLPGPYVRTIVLFYSFFQRRRVCALFWRPRSPVGVFGLESLCEKHDSGGSGPFQCMQLYRRAEGEEGGKERGGGGTPVCNRSVGLEFALLFLAVMSMFLPLCCVWLCFLVRRMFLFPSRGWLPRSAQRENNGFESGSE